MTATTITTLQVAKAKMRQLLELGYCKATAIFDTIEHMMRQGFDKDEAKAAAEQAHMLLA